MATEKQEREWWFQSIAEGEHGPLHNWLAVSHNEDGTLNGGSIAAEGPSANKFFYPSVANKTGGTYAVKLMDTTNAKMVAIDAGLGQIKDHAIPTDPGSQDWSQGWSSNKGFPTGVTWDKIGAGVYFKGNYYFQGTNTGASTSGIYSCAPTTGNTAFTWSSALTFTSGATFFVTGICTDGTYIYAAEYGDPTGGPALWRSSDGSTWTAIQTLTGVRHIHAVAIDPHTGYLWMTIGDGVSGPIRYSTDNGATFTSIPVRSGFAYVPQCVGIAFDKDFVYLAPDSEYASLLVIEKSTGLYFWGTQNFHANHAVPGGSYSTGTTGTATVASGATSVSVTHNFGSTPTAGQIRVTPTGLGSASKWWISSIGSTTFTINVDADPGASTATFGWSVGQTTIAPNVFDGSPFYVAHDETNGVTYIAVPSSTGHTTALFYVNKIGGRVELITYNEATSGPLFIANGYLWSSAIHRPLIGFETAPAT